MSLTFGIITAGGNETFIHEIISSIRAQHIPFYEIIIVGGPPVWESSIQHIPFDESGVKGWITRKKNIICREAKYDTIVLIHDYIALEPGWYEGYLKYGFHFSICVNPIITIEGGRYLDYCLNKNYIGDIFNDGHLLPYSYKASKDINKIMYISGAYYLIKKDTALKFPLDERLAHNHGDDIHLCQTLALNDIPFNFNPHSTVRLLKKKEFEGKEITAEKLEIINSFTEEDLDRLFFLQLKGERYYVFQACGVLI
jgi:hypothetical protein